MSERKRIIIVGGVAGGASAAARARRLSEDAEIIMFERGEYISFANCGLPYHIGGEIEKREKLLVQTPELMRKRFRIDVRTQTEILRIDREKKEITAKDLTTNKEYQEQYDALILSPGAAPVRPPIPGVDCERVKTLRNMDDMDTIIHALEEMQSKRAVVVGGGFIGLEMAEALRHRGLDVTIVEMTQQVMAPADPEMVSFLHQELKLNSVDLRLGVSVTAFQEKENSLQVELSDGGVVDCGLAILSIGVKPEVTLARDAGLTIGALNGIQVDESMRTNDPSIYAVGDAIEVRDFISGNPVLIPLAGPANRQGRIAADRIFERNTVYKRTQGTAICKVFNMTFAMTGLSEKAAKRVNVPYEKVYVHPTNHAGYYPGACSMSLKLLFDPKDGKILGAQAVGADGVDKRIDALAIALRAGLTAFELEEMELSYAPPYGSAKDPVNYAGFAAANFLRGDVRLCHVEDVVNPKHDQLILDVRMDKEVKAGVIPESIVIPLDELRDRLNELPRDKELLVLCQVGLRGYLACRILSQHGFNCRNLTGGYKTYLMVTGRIAELTLTPKKNKTESTNGEGKTAFTISAPAKIVKQIDACGMQCPGPIQQLKSTIDAMQVGEAVQITASDPGFAADAPAWCHSTGHKLIELESTKGQYRATIEKCDTSESSAQVPTSQSKNMTIVVFSNDFDRVMAAFIIANGAAAMGRKVTLFFTFWGLNALRKDKAVPVKKNLVEKMFGWMMPRGPEKLALSKMHMAGIGLAMIKGIMRKKNASSLPELIQSAKASNVTFVACAMSMDLMGIKREELIDGVEEGGVAMYLDHAAAGNVNLFV